MTRDHDSERKAKLEEGDRIESQVREARALLAAFAVRHMGRENARRYLAAHGPFSLLEAGDALDEIAIQDRRKPT